MSLDLSILKQLNNILKNKGYYYKNFKSYLLPLKDKLPLEISQKIDNIITKENPETSELDDIVNDILLEIYSIKRGDYNRLKEPLVIKFSNFVKTLEQLKKIGIETAEDIIFHFPYKYDILSSSSNDRCVLTGTFEDSKIVKTKNGKKILEAVFKGDTGYFYGVWFNFNNRYPLLLLKKGENYNLYGKLQNFNGLPAIVHPEFLSTDELGKIRPVYLLPENVKDNLYLSLLKKVYMEYSEHIVETLPLRLIIKYGFLDLKNSLRYIHFPDNINEFKKYNLLSHRRFVYEELFYLQLGLFIRKNSYGEVRGIKFDIDKDILLTLKPYIPFKLTDAQKKALKDIFNDMKSSKQMNRLLQGDVGSGKTVVAFISGVLAVKNGYQVAFISPTEILAEQHYNNFKKLFKDDFSSCLITGSLKQKDKKYLKALVESGDISFIFGTHAILQEDTIFKNLGFVVIDEQHRFGVMQRKILIEKGYTPDILLMSATPIPRTLSLTFYGDLEISIIDQLPPGRKPITTKAFRQKEIGKVFDLVKEQIEKGFSAYFVYPLIDESDTLDLKAATQAYEQVAEFFGEDNVGILHGRMKAEEKNYLMNRFKNREIKILVSTTVIEVGVDVPHATVMVIENAERFGLSQLHQLRGRVGRGGDQSFCYLVYSDKISEDGLKRIKAMINYNDGFKLSEIDLEMRGPGDFFGTRQSGLPDLKFSNIIKDTDILLSAREDAFEILKEDPYLNKPENRILKEMLKFKWKDAYELVNIG
ncbi:ATP-dependent DNA helicase RecG [Calditerrivibrio nitroreducens]|uniref:ATP-dependent DNA helicase RecG n=1 Tax=Calditerrivibrio nitroreducens (strain DSM 19672 / NBRC 101217 / Yu37-1) TaxID=768670 RepID=E4THX5_CALNY|nr:ATP-dependent DNA helicase RecG [Calditerrivibrio nitroreducens]ADR18905.1 ATP-dependent DNA helicase RecG [Calditerrivibrio nitroreducens DSM 19672]